MSESSETEDFIEVEPHELPPSLKELRQFDQADNAEISENDNEMDQDKSDPNEFTVLFVPPHGDVWECRTTPENWPKLARELVLGPGAPEAQDLPDPSTYVEMLEFRSASSDWQRAPFRFKPLIVGMDAMACQHGHKNDKATALMTGIRVLRKSGKSTMIISGPVVVASTTTSGIGSDTDSSEDEDVISGEPAPKEPDTDEDAKFVDFTRKDFEKIWQAWTEESANQ